MAAYTEALKECTRERVPFAWAKTQHNLDRAIPGVSPARTRTALACLSAVNSRICASGW